MAPSLASRVTILACLLCAVAAEASEARKNCGDGDESGETGECAAGSLVEDDTSEDEVPEHEEEQHEEDETAEPTLMHQVELMNFRTLDQVKLDYDKNIKMFRNQTWFEVENRETLERWETPFNYTCHMRPRDDPMGRPDDMWQAMFGVVKKAKEEAAAAGRKVDATEERLERMKSLPEEFTFQVPQSRGFGKAGRVWAGSAVLARALEGGLVDLPQGARVLELGAGTGLLSLVLSKCMSRLQLDVTATELPGTALDNLQAIVSDLGTDADSAVTVDGLDWQNTTKLQYLRPFDAVVGGNLIYEREHTQLMLDLINEVGERGFLKELLESERFSPMYVSKKELSRVMYPLHSEESWLLVLQQK